MIRITKVYPVFLVRNLDEALAYYRDRLGFAVTWKWGNPPTRAGVAIDQIEFQLDAAGADALPWQSVVYCHVMGLDAYYERCRERGAVFERALGHRPWGMRDFQVVDPSGNRIGFGETV